MKIAVLYMVCNGMHLLPAVYVLMTNVIIVVIMLHQSSFRTITTTSQIKAFAALLRSPDKILYI